MSYARSRDSLQRLFRLPTSSSPLRALSLPLHHKQPSRPAGCFHRDAGAATERGVSKSPHAGRMAVPLRALPNRRCRAPRPARRAWGLLAPSTAGPTWRGEVEPKRRLRASVRGAARAGTWRCARVRAGGTWRPGSMAEWRAVPSDLFPFVLAFLRENRFEGAARAFAREAAAVSGAGGDGGAGRAAE